MTETATVDYIADAKTGDRIWFYDSHANRYDENSKYLGRGVWSLKTIEDENRASFIVYHGTKFDRKDGTERTKNGYTSGYIIAGQKEYEGRVWMDKHSYKVRQMFERTKDIDILKQVAALLGYDDSK